MSDHSTEHALEEDHTGPIKNPKQLLMAVFFSFVVPIFAIIALVYFVISDNKPAAGTVNMEQTINQRLQKVGSVEIRDANRELKSGEDVFKAHCSSCHTSGLLKAPKFGDAGEWGPRVKTGLDALLNSALKGKGSMTAQAGGDFEDLEIARAVVYMANAGGGKFEAPKAPAVAAAAPEAAK